MSHNSKTIAYQLEKFVKYLIKIYLCKIES